MHSGAGLEPRKKASASQLTSSGRARPNQRSYYVLPFAWDTELDLHHQSKWEKLVRYHLGQVCLRVLSPLVTVSPGWGAGVILCTPTVLEGKAETPGAPLLSLRFTVNKWPHQGLNAHDWIPWIHSPRPSDKWCQGQASARMSPLTPGLLQPEPRN